MKDTDIYFDCDFKRFPFPDKIWEEERSAFGFERDFLFKEKMKGFSREITSLRIT